MKMQNRPKFGKKNKISKSRNWKAVAIALYFTFLMVSMIPFIAERNVQPNMKDSYEYHLRYPCDGRQTHYYVERVDTAQIGTIDLTYTTSTNSLDVTTKNIDVLYIFCRSMYKDECKKVFGFDPSDNYNYFKWYFIEKNHLVVKIDSDSVMKELSFIDTPIPYQVIVNGLKWVEGRQYNYTDNYGTVLSHVPKGNTHVDIYFRTNNQARPFASFIADTSISNINNLIKFDATASYDIDGEITAYIWDFGDGNNSGGVVNTHIWTVPGVYTVILTVRDNDFLIDQAFLNITIVQGSNIPVINGVVPNQIQEEDAPPWELDLKRYGIDLDSSPNELRWYLTGENTNLYNVLGENSTDQKLIFSPVDNSYGNDLVTLWLKDKDGYNTSQPLWINITPINDKPIIDNLPNLVVHYNVEYRFTITPYISDIETPRERLSVTAQDRFGNKYVNVVGHDIIFLYPESLLGEIILTTVTVSDGEDSSEAIITVTITDNWPPTLLYEIPDIELYEGTVKYDIFKLADYFVDPDGDELYYTYKKSNVIIFIKANSSVDIISQGEWTGEEEVIFRARDPNGGFVEDVIKIKVLPINDPPVIGDVPDIKVHFDRDYYFDLSYYVKDRDNELWELTLTTSDPGHIRISPENNLGLILNYPKLLLGTTSRVTLTVSDGQLQTSIRTNVTVIEEYPPELVKKLPDVTFKEDEELIDYLDLNGFFFDFDNDSLYYTSGHRMISITISSEYKVSFSAVENWYGIEKVIFRATDPTNAFVEDSIYVTVLPVNDPPIIDTLPVVTINETEIFELDLRPYISDIDTNISNLNIIVEDPNIMVSGSSLVIFGSSEIPKEVEVYVNDGDLTTQGLLYVKVKTESPPINSVNIYIITLIIILIVLLITILAIVIYRIRKQKDFEIEEIFLIHNSGKLLNHLYYKTHSKFDDEIFSGMFTAIQEFIEDSFTRDPNNISNKSNEGIIKIPELNKPIKLNEFKVGDNQVIVEHGKFIFMAIVYTGSGSLNLHKVVKRTISAIEFRYKKHLEYWDGEMTHFLGLKELIHKLLPKKQSNKIFSNTQKNILRPENFLIKKIKRPDS